MTVLGTRVRARTMDFEAGDVGYIEKTLPHLHQQHRRSEIRFIEVFRASRFLDLSLSEWLSHSPPNSDGSLNIDRATYDEIPKEKLVVLR